MNNSEVKVTYEIQVTDETLPKVFNLHKEMYDVSAEEAMDIVTGKFQGQVRLRRKSSDDSQGIADISIDDTGVVNISVHD